MRILLLTQYFAPEVGASQVRLSAFCRELRAAGHEVEVVTAMPHHPEGRIYPGYRGRFYCCEVLDGVTIHRVWLYTAKGSSFKRILSYLSFALLCLFGLLRARRPDYLFVDSPPLFLAVPGWLASCLWKIPFIFNVADLWPDSVLDLGIMRPGVATKVGFVLEEWTYRHADFITAVTEGIRTSLLQRKGVPAAKVLFLPNGVDTSFFRPTVAPDERLRAQFAFGRKKIVLYAGNHGYANSVDQLIEAASLITDPTIHFLIIGDGPQKPSLQARAHHLGLGNVTFLDPVPIEKLPSFLSITSIAAVTLRKSPVTEGARSAKAFVMMAAAKPIVLAGRGESADLIRQADAGIVVPPHSPEEFAEGILLLANNPDLAARMGNNGRAFVQTYFDWTLLVRNWLAQLPPPLPQGNASPTPQTENFTTPMAS
jgi:colanic acid biosynthesis glycosyl transferase WcaI